MPCVCDCAAQPHSSSQAPSADELTLSQSLRCISWPRAPTTLSPHRHRYSSEKPQCFSWSPGGTRMWLVCPDHRDLPHTVPHNLSDLRQVVLNASVSLLGQPWHGGWWDTDHSRCLLCVGYRKHGSSVRFWCLSRAVRTGARVGGWSCYRKCGDARKELVLHEVQG